MKKRSKNASTPPRTVDAKALAELRGGDGPIVPVWVPEQHNETFVRRAKRRR